MEQAQHFWRLAVTSFSVMFGFIPILLIVGRDTIDWDRLIRLAAMLFVAWFVAAFLPSMGIVNFFLRQHSRLRLDADNGPPGTSGYMQVSLLWIIPIISLCLRSGYRIGRRPSAAKPPCWKAFFQRLILDTLTDNRSTTSVRSFPSRRSFTAITRRTIESAAGPGVLMHLTTALAIPAVQTPRREE
jgi:hypothetical protein